MENYIFGLMLTNKLYYVSIILKWNKILELKERIMARKKVAILAEQYFTKDGSNNLRGGA